MLLQIWKSRIADAENLTIRSKCIKFNLLYNKYSRLYKA